MISWGFIQFQSDNLKPGRDYVEVGYYYSESLRAWTVFLPHADEATARAVADRYYNYNIKRDCRFNMEPMGIMKCSVQFFDSLAYTPDWNSYTLKLSDTQKKHQVAVFWYDYQTGEKIFRWIRKEERNPKESLQPPQKLTPAF